MPGTPPTTATFPSPIKCKIVPPLSSAPPAMILILLHSIGDHEQPFAQLGGNLNLPETTCISLRAPRTIPYDFPGYQWGEDISFSSTGKLLLDAKFDQAGYQTIKTVVEKLIETGWRAREIMFFGWGQGAICAFDYLSHNLETEYGGLISIGGIVGDEVKTVITKDSDKGLTPILACGGQKGLLTGPAEDRIKSLFKDVQVVRWAKDGDGMMRNRDEAMPVIKFFSRRLLSRQGVPEGFTEVSV